MDKIQDVLKVFSERELRDFRYFLVRHRPGTERKDLKFLQQLIAGEGHQEKNRGEAYHSIRKRIKLQLLEFVGLMENRFDAEEGSAVLGNAAMARFLFTRKQNERAWEFLLKAERGALLAERYDLLIGVYKMMIEHAQFSEVYSLEELFSRLAASKQMADEDERLVCAIAMIRRKMEEIKQSGNPEGFSVIVEQTLDAFQLSSSILRRPGHIFRIMEIVRTSYLALRDLSNFESVVLEQFERFDRVAGSEPRYHEMRLNFLYVVAHVLYHNRKYSECEHWLIKLNTEMEKFGGRLGRNYASQYHSMNASILTFGGKNEEAILHLEKVTSELQNTLRAEDVLNLRLNLVFAYFIARDFRKANRFFVQLDMHSDSYYIRKMGQEWLLRCKMIRLIVQYELGNEDVSLQIIKQIEKDFSVLLNQSVYLKAKNFIGFLRAYMMDPFSISFNDFHQRALRELFVVPAGTEESKAIAFYCWLKSKILGREYYAVLLEEVNSFREE